ncbi:MAG: tol-pal system protein YbgF [Alphaproteobacteria bacterium]
MNKKIIYIAFSLIILSCFNLNKCYSQNNDETINNINERILNRLEGLNTKINDLERRVYQGKEVNSANHNQDVNIKNNYKVDADQERRLLELEEKTRSTEGVIEEIKYLKEKINNLIQQNSKLLIKIENLNKGSDINNKITEEKITEDTIPEEYPIYPGMNNSESSNKNENSSSEVLAKINTTSGNDEIIKETINVQKDKLVSEEISISEPNKEPKDIYQRAYNMLSKGNYEAAEVAFVKFIKDFSDHSLTSNAYYWLGESFYVRKNYIQAAQNFAEGYKKFPKGSKASAQLLKLGISLYALNKNKEACSTFAKLDKEFIELPLNISNRARTYKEKLECK